MVIASNNRSVHKSLCSSNLSLWFGGFDCISEQLLELKEQKSYHFTISYSQTAGAAQGVGYTSPDFVVGGFSWNIVYLPEADQGCIGLYLERRGPCDGAALAMYAFHLMDKRGNLSRSLTTLHNFDDTGNERWGWSDFMTRIKLEEEYIPNDLLSIDCELAVYDITALDEAIKSPAGSAPPSELQSDLGMLLESKDMADIAFLVDGETIPAHKTLLGARSPVFKALLYGPMSQSTPECIPIVDMKASVFKVVLHYIYTDSLPNDVTLIDHEKSDNSTADLEETGKTMQHILEAADRYGLDKLKSICEDNLCRTLNIDTAATTLALAHQHGCNKLKMACLEYMEDPKNYVEITLTAGFLHLLQSSPEMMPELKNVVEKMRKVSLTQ